MIVLSSHAVFFNHFNHLKIEYPMTTKLLKLLVLPTFAATLLFTACGEKSESPEEATAPVDTFTYPDAPDEAMRMVLGELAKGNGGVLWRAMPASYQKDVNAIAQLAGTKIDPEIYDKVFATVGRIGSVLDKQKEFVFNASLMGEAPDAEQVAQTRAAWPSIMHIIEELTSSSLASASGLQSFDGQAFFKDTVSGLLTDMETLSQLDPDSEEPSFSDLANAEIKYLEGTGEVATLEMSMPDEEVETETFVKVEDRWVPQEMADDWSNQMTEARAKLEAIDPKQMEKQKPQIMGVFAMIDGVLAQIEAAETQQQFDQALQGAMMPLMGLMMMGGSMGGGGAAPGAPEMPVMPPMPTAPSTPSAP